jgi:transposase
VFPRIKTVKGTKGQTYEYLVISESEWQKGKGSVIKDVAKLGNVKKFSERNIEQLINGLIRLFGIEKFGLAENVEILESLEYGRIIFWRHLWNKMKLTKIISRQIRKQEGRVKINAAAFVEIMTVNRCCDPLSKLAASRWKGDTCYKLMKGYGDLSDEVEYYYRSMDYLLKVKDAVELEIFKRLETLFSINVKLTFYDITSTFFYTDNCPIGKKGHSRDHRSDKEQIVIGVVTSDEGYPIKHYVFTGNTKDETTVSEVVSDLRKRFNIEETVFVGDRGMITKLNLEKILAEDFSYIMGVKHKQDAVVQKFFDNDELDFTTGVDYKNLKLLDKRIEIKNYITWKCETILEEEKIKPAKEAFDKFAEKVRLLDNKSEVAYKDFKGVILGIADNGNGKLARKLFSVVKKFKNKYEEEKRFVFCLNSDRRGEASSRREEKLKVFEGELNDAAKRKLSNEIDLTKALEKIFEGYKRRYRKFFNIETSSDGSFSFERDVEAINKDSRYDGVFIVTSNRKDLSPVKQVASYKNLQEVEILFDDLKHFVDIHPVRHWLEIRVRAHVFICVLSLLLKRIFEIEHLKNKALTLPLEDIKRVKLVKYSIRVAEGSDKRLEFPKVTNLSQEQKRYFKMIGIRNPGNLENYAW